MSVIGRILLGSCVAVSLMAPAAFAQSQSASLPDKLGATDSKVEAGANDRSSETAQLLRGGSPLGLSLLSFFYGPTVGDAGSGLSPTSFKDDRSGLSLQNQLALQYDVNNQISIAPTFDFEWLMTDPSGQLESSQRVALSYDSFIRVSDNGVMPFQLGGHAAWFNTDLRLYVPTSDFSRNNNSLGSVRLTVTPNLQFANSPVSVAVVTFARYFLQRQDTLTGAPDVALPQLQFYAAPLVNYDMGRGSNFWAMIESTLTYDTQGTPNTSDPNRSLVDFEPGMDFRVNDKITVSPFLNWFTSRPLTTTSINVMAHLSI